MKTVAEWLREGDPIAAERGLSDADARRMRQSVLAQHGRERNESGTLWRGVAVLASLALVAVALGSWLSEPRRGRTPGTVAEVTVETPRDQPPPRQVQFVTPRGTRVVWVLQAETPTQEGMR